MSLQEKPLRSALKSSSRASSPNPLATARVPVPPSPGGLTPASLPPSPPVSTPTAAETAALAASAPPPLTHHAVTDSVVTPTNTVSFTESPPNTATQTSHQERFQTKDVPSGNHAPPTHYPSTPTLHSAFNRHHHDRAASVSSLSGSGKPYTPKVSFDTFENPLASMFSFTLQVKSAGHKRTRNTRVYLCAASPDESGQQALDWCLESLVQDGDEVIVFRGVEEEVLEKDHNLVREEARGLMRSLQEKSAEVDKDRKLSLILEYIPGKITDSIDRLIALYRPDSLIVGTRGKRGLMGLNITVGIGSISKYCLSHSPVPVIVVRPERKLKKAQEKRKADPKRGTHFDS